VEQESFSNSNSIMEQSNEQPIEQSNEQPIEQPNEQPNEPQIQPESKQPTFNIGMLGHVAHGKSTLVRAISGIRTQKHSKEDERGITIKLGYANAKIYQNEKTGTYGTDPEKFKGPDIKTKFVSFVDCPGHEILIQTMLSGTSVMDCIILIISATEKCPQPQTLEHLIALDMIMNKKGIRNVIIVQNKIDLVTKQRALESYDEIQETLKHTLIQGAPIIPVSAQFNIGIGLVLKQLMLFDSSQRQDTRFKMHLIRSFDVNKPGTLLEHIKGGVIGGSIYSGQINDGDDIMISPGILSNGTYHVIKTKVMSIYSEQTKLDTATSGGLISLGTLIDPNFTINDRIVGNMVTKHEIPVFNSFNLVCNWVRTEKFKVEPGMDLLLNIHSATVNGTVDKIMSKTRMSVKLKYPIATEYNDIVFISIKKRNRYVLAGVSSIANDDFSLYNSSCNIQKTAFIEFDYTSELMNIYNKLKSINITKISLPSIELEKHNRKVVFVNFDQICKKFNRPPEHVKNFLSDEMGIKNANQTAILENGQLRIGGIITNHNIQSLIKKYAREFVCCHACHSTCTLLTNKQIHCNTCNYNHII